MKKLKILHAVESYYPSVSGAPEVVRHLSERMVKAGHDVTVATRKLPNRKSLVHNGVKIVEFNIRPTSPLGLSTVTGLAGDTKKYQDYLIKNKFDVVMTYAAQQWTTDLMLPILDKIRAKKVIVPCGYSGLYDPMYKQYFKELPTYLRKFDASVYLSDDYRDINFARKNKLKNINLIANGADENEFADLPTAAQKQKLREKYGIKGLMLMTVGNYTGEKGHAELIAILKRLPVRNVTLVSAGTATPGVGSYDMFKTQANLINNNRSLLGKKVVMIDGTNRKLILQMLKCADLFTFLSNIEASPLVLYEANAAGIPFLATAAGNSAEIASWTGGGVIVKTHPIQNGRVRADLKDALWQITKLAYSSAKRRRLGTTGRATWKDKYTWEKLTNDYLNLYQSLLDKKGLK
ncbi:MAG: glycosyltransferase family 4 protein [Deltaproteobacteria bacterium]|nr:glycosyltransferase family 4 protein [Deltaproteobacteria bacterium]